MTTPVRVLIVEDSEDDAQLLLRELRSGGYDPQWTRVDSPEGLRSALEEQAWDVIICDYSLPHMDGLRALKIVREGGRDIPFIIVSGKTGEDTAVAAMKAGAHDYVMKDRLDRLPVAVERELHDASVRAQHRKLERDVRENAEAIRMQAEILCSAPVIAAFHDLDHNILWVNRAYEQATGLSQKDIIGKKCYAVWRLAKPCRGCPVSTAIDSDEASEAELTPQNQDHWPESQGYWLSRAAPMHDADGKVIGATEVALDITGLKRAEAALRQKNLVFDASLAANSIADFSGVVTEANDSFVRTWGYASKDEVVGRPIASFLQNQDEAVTITTALNSTGEWEGDYTAKRKDGSVFTAHGLATVIRNDAGEVAGYQSSVMDVTAEREAVARREHLTQVLKAIRNVNQLIVREKDPARLIQQACELFIETRGCHGAWIGLGAPGSPPTALAQAGCGECFEPFARNLAEGRWPMCREISASAPDGFASLDPEVVCRACPLGGEHDLGLAAVSCLRHQGRDLGMLGLSFARGMPLDEEEKGLLIEAAGDIAFALHGIESETKRRQSEGTLQAIFQAANDGILLADAESGRFVFGNDSICRMLGYSAEEIELFSVADIHLPEDLDSVRALFERQVRGEIALAMDIPIKRKDGTVFVADVNSAPLEFGGRRCLVGIFRDITERKRAEERLRESFAQLERALQGTIDVISRIVEMRDPYTAGHQKRVEELAVAIARQMGLPEDSCVSTISMAALIHDIGKVAVPSEILSKPGKLSEAEFSLIKAHPRAAYDILKQAALPYPVPEIVLQHHERYDGMGYPSGLRGDDILPEASIIAVADVVEAMCSHRPYRAGLGIDAALGEIRNGSGTRYYPDVVDACIAVFKDNGFTFSS